MQNTTKSPSVSKWVQALACGLGLLGCSDHEFMQGKIKKKQPTNVSEVQDQELDTRDVAAATTLSSEPELITATFPVLNLRDESFRFSLDLKNADLEFTLKDINTNTTETHSQATRRAGTEIFRQGHLDLVVDETFQQEGRKGKVDILVVIDDSVSMFEEQSNLSNKMNELISALGNADWQIGVITTSFKPSCMLQLIRSDDPFAVEKFRMAVSAGTLGDRNEQGILQAIVGLSCPATPWVRDTSTVAVLIVSDEDNCSYNGVDCENTLGYSENDLIQYVEGTLGREVGKSAGFYGIFSPPSAPCISASNTAVIYQRLVDYKANGAVNYGNICDASYAPTLKTISNNIATLLTNKFELKQSPLNGSIVLRLRLSDGTEIELPASDYITQDKLITFKPGREPPEGSQIFVRYRTAGAPLFTEVTLQQEPAKSTVKVQINGVETREFTVNGRVVSFPVAPPKEAEVVIDYRENTALFQRFQLSHLPLSDSLRVEVDGQATTRFQFNAAAREVVLSEVPGDGTKINFSFTYRVGPQLDYALPLAAGSTNFKLSDGISQVPFVERDGLFTIPAAMHQRGKTLHLQFQTPDDQLRVFRFPHTPVEQSARVEWGVDSCQLGAGLEVRGDSLFAQCAVRGLSDFQLSYQYKELLRSFTLPGISEPERGLWTVYVDQVPVQNYKRQGSTITFENNHAESARVTLRYSRGE